MLLLDGFSSIVSDCLADKTMGHNFNMLIQYAHIFATATLILLFSPVSAFWRLSCMGVAGVARIDPLVSPGKQSGHVHTIKISSGMFGLNAL